jgi:threonine/homoserine/homoserine lactone efflux protein
LELFYLLVKGLVIGVSVSIPMGPIGVLCVQRTLNRGQLSGMISGCGAAAADSFFALVAGMGLGFLASFFNEQQIMLMLLGGAMLIFLGLRLYFTDVIKTVRQPGRNRKSGLLGDFVSVFFLTLSNPVTILFFGAVFAGLNLLENAPKYASAILVSGVAAGALLWWGVLTTLVHAFRSKFRLRGLVMLNKIAGIIITCFGLFAISSLFF